MTQLARPAFFRSRLALLAALGTGAFACGNPTHEDRTLNRASVTNRRLHPSGHNLLDEHGRIVLLRGFNAGGRAKMPPYVPFDLISAPFAPQADDYFAAFQRLGANVVRLTLAWEALEPTRGARDLDYCSATARSSTRRTRTASL